MNKNKKQKVFDNSPTDSLLDHIHADREHWMDYALSRFDYRKK